MAIQMRRWIGNHNSLYYMDVIPDPYPNPGTSSGNLG